MVQTKTHYNPFAKHCSLLDLEHGSEAWLAARRKLVTASDLPILLGSNSTITPLQLWQQKQSPAERLNARQLEYGLHMEELILGWAAEDLMASESRLVNWTVRSIAYPFLSCTLDGILRFDSEDSMENCPLEIKTSKFGAFDTDEQKLKFYHQLQTQILITGAARGFLAILPSGNSDKLIVEEVKADKAMQASIIEAAKQFHACMEGGKEPVARADDLKDMHYNPEADTYEPDEAFKALYDEFSSLNEQLKAKTEGSRALEAKLKDLKAAMAQAMGESPQAFFFKGEKEVYITRKKIDIKEQVKPAYSYYRVDVKEK